MIDDKEMIKKEIDRLKKEIEKNEKKIKSKKDNLEITELLAKKINNVSTAIENSYSENIILAKRNAEQLSPHNKFGLRYQEKVREIFYGTEGRRVFEKLDYFKNNNSRKKGLINEEIISLQRKISELEMMIDELIKELYEK